MRTARLVGLSPDGTTLIVATDSGEELAIPADERLRAAVRGDRPRLGQLEIEMESSLTPRDIQTRIRSGSSLEDVARVAGLPMERVERFAAPVLAEREHVAALAGSASVRRRGETAGHRSLRITVAERLHGRGIDADSVRWDSYRMEDGRWAITADYRSGEAARNALFCYDPQGRFSVAGNDEARWLLGEQSSAKGPQPGRRRPVEPVEAEDDNEPTLDLNDELALVRATVEPSHAAEATEPTVPVRRLRPVADLPPEPEVHPEPDDRPAAAATARPPAGDDGSQLDTLYRMLRGEPDGAEPAPAAGPNDASAVPDTVPAAGWEPTVVPDYPVEPAEDEEPELVPGPTDTTVPAEPGPLEAPAPTAAPPEIDVPTTPGAPDDVPDEPTAPAPVEPDAAPASRTPKRKRAAVPSWDEIMFGGPKRR